MEPSSGARDVHQTCTRRGSREGLETKQVPVKPGLASSRRAYQAERGGFEPPRELSPPNGLANRRFRPLSHLSGTGPVRCGSPGANYQTREVGVNRLMGTIPG